MMKKIVILAFAAFLFTSCLDMEPSGDVHTLTCIVTDTLDTKLKGIDIEVEAFDYGTETTSKRSGTTDSDGLLQFIYSNITDNMGYVFELTDPQGAYLSQRDTMFLYYSGGTQLTMNLQFFMIPVPVNP